MPKIADRLADFPQLPGDLIVHDRREWLVSNKKIDDVSEDPRNS